MAGRYEQLCNRLHGGSTTQRQPRVASRCVLLLGLALTCMSAAGCVTLANLCPAEKPPVGSPCKLATYWDNGLRQTFDTVNGGAPLRGLSGRLYLLDSQSPTWVTCEGTVIVDLYDDGPLATGGEAIHLEQWRFPNDVLKLLLRKNGFGWGYTLFLPWVNSYRPDITQVHLRVCFVRLDGSPLYAASSTISLAQPDAVLPPGTAQARAAKQALPANTPAAMSAQMAAVNNQNYNAPPAVLRLGGPTPTPPVVPATAQAPNSVPTQPASMQSAAQQPDQPKPITIPVRGKPRPLPTQTQAITQTSAQMPVQVSQPAPQPAWVGQAK